MRLSRIAVGALLCLLASPAAANPPQPPVAAKIPYTVSSPRGDRVDEYYWLRDDDPKSKRPEILAYLQAERAYTEAMMAPLRPLTARVLDEMKARLKPDDSTAPYYDNGYWYWRRFDPDAEYTRYLRRRGSPAAMAPDAADEVLLDLPQLASGKAFYAVRAYAVSPDNRWLAFVEDTQGRRISTLRVRDLTTGEFLADAIAGVLESIVWAADSRTLFYIRQDPQLLQSGPVYRHVLGTPATDDRLVYDEPDKTLFTRVLPTASREFVQIFVGGFATTGLLVVPAGNPQAAPRVVLPRRVGVRSHADHLAGRWVIRTNDAGHRYRGIALHVPFVDAVTTMLDPTIPLTVNEWTQWGDPRLPGYYEYILSYSPYDNIARGPYPALFVSTGLWDSQVQYFEPAKYVARLRARKTDTNPLLFSINLDAGHSGRSGRFAELEERAMQFAFFLSLAGIRN